MAEVEQATKYTQHPLGLICYNQWNDNDDAAAVSDDGGVSDCHTISSSVNIKRVLIVLLMILTYKTPFG